MYLISRAALVFAFALLPCSQVNATPTIGTPVVNPASLVVNQSAALSATCQVSTVPGDPQLITDGVDLLRVSSGGANSVIGVMHDTGNGIYALQFTDTEPTVGSFQVQCTAAFQGLLQRVKSPLTTITVVSSAGSGSIGTITLAPISIPYGVATPVTVTAPISGGTPDDGGVMLQRLDSSGRVLAILGTLHDDGLNGDPVANDGNYTLVTTFSEFQVGAVPLRVSATFSGAVNHVLSPIATLTMTGTPPPTIRITSPESLSFLNLSPTTVNGTVSDPGATVVINSIAAAVDPAGNFSASIPLAEGPNILTATATSPNGSIGTASIQVTLDTTPPHVTITSPVDQFVTSEATISVAGNVNDIVVGTVNSQQAQVTVNGIASQVANRTFLAQNVPLKLGSNTIQAVAVDRAGNSATTQITVVRQAPQPGQITVVSGNNQTATIGTALPAPLVVALTDPSGKPAPNQPVLFSVTQNNGLLSSAGGAPAASVLATTDANGQATANWTLGMRSGAGSDAVQAYSVGFSGTAVFTATAKQGTPGMIVVDTGNNQTGAVNQTLPKPFIVVVTDAGHNRLPNIPVTFTVVQGGGNFGGQATTTVNTDSDGRAGATLTLGFQEGNSNNLVTADFPGDTGFPASFTASGLAPGDPGKTVISGLVLDNTNQPVPGATVRTVLTNALNASVSAAQTAPAVQADATGHFSIYKAPVGYLKLLVDGSTATVPGTFPSLEYDMVTVPGQVNTLDKPIFLLPIKSDNQLCVSDTTGGGTLTIPEAPGFSLTFAPGQVTFPGGSKTGCVSVTVVHPDKVPMVPGFGQQPRFIVTIQPSGALFNPPAPITLPNVDGLKPREVTEMYSYDHDISSFVAIGTGTVSDDGQVIRSNPGIGVLKAGWHCGGNPNTAGAAATCGPCAYCDGTNCQPDPAKAGKGCQNSCLVGAGGTCTNGHCTGQVNVGAPCGNGGACDRNGNCVFPNGAGGGGCGNCNSGNPCIDDSCGVNSQCVASSNQLCQNACNGLPSGAACTVGNLTGTCDSSGNCNLCSSLGAGASCTCSGGGLGTCNSSGQCNCPCQLTIQDLGPVAAPQASPVRPSVARSLPLTSAISPALVSCPLPGSVPTIVVGEGTAQQVGVSICSGGNCPSNFGWKTDDPSVAFVTNGSCSSGPGSAVGSNAIVCPAPGAVPGLSTVLHLLDPNNVDQAEAEIAIGGKVQVKIKSKCGIGYTGALTFAATIGTQAQAISVGGTYNLSTDPINGPEFSGQTGSQVIVNGTYIEKRPRADRLPNSTTCQATVPASGENDCTLEFDIDCSAPTVKTTLSPMPRNSDPQGNQWINAQDLAAANPPNEITQTFTCSDPDDTPALSDVKVCGPDSSSGVMTTLATPAVNGRGQVFPAFSSDLVGNSSSLNPPPSVNVDTIPPTLNGSISPEPNANHWNNTTNVTVTFTAQDQQDLSGIADALSRTDVNGVTTPGLTRTVSGDGMYSITAFAADYARNQTSVGVLVKIDTTPPIAAITSPPNGTTLSTATATITGTITDGTGSGVDPGRVRCNNGVILSNATVTGNSFSCIVTLLNATNTITVQANDLADNFSISQPLTIHYLPSLPTDNRQLSLNGRSWAKSKPSRANLQ